MPQLSTRIGPLQTSELFNFTDANVADPFANRNTDFELWMRNATVSGNPEEGGTTHIRSTRRTSTDISMPDYTPMNTGATEAPGVREEDGSAHLRVPANTPTASATGNFEHDGLLGRLIAVEADAHHDDAAVPFPMLSHNSAIPSDLANSLTNSLLNQPMPVHLQHHAQNFHTPAAEIKSRKENRSRATGPSPSGVTAASAPDHYDMRRVSQQMFMPPSGTSMPMCTLSPEVDSQQNQECVIASGAPSKAAGLCASKVPSCDASLGSTPGSALEKGLKRIRNFTPVSARVIDEEDEPRRRSPRIRLTPFADDEADS